MPNVNSPKRKAKSKIALNILIIAVVVTGALWVGSYWLQMPTASLLSGKVAEESTVEVVKNKAKDVAELYYTYSAGDSPLLLQNMLSSTTKDMQKKIEKTIEERSEVQGGFMQVATVIEITETNIRERAAALDYDLTIQRYRIGMEAQEQIVSVSIKLVNEDGRWLLSALSPNKILWP